MADIRSGFRLLDLGSLQFAAVRSTGAMAVTAASFSTIGNVVPDSAHLILDPADETEIMIQESEWPDVVARGGQKASLEFALRDMGPKTMYFAFGGITASTLYKFSTTAMTVNEYCIKAISKAVKGTGGSAARKATVSIPRASVNAGADLRFAKNDTGQINFTARILIPASSTDISPCTIAWTA